MIILSNGLFSRKLYSEPEEDWLLPIYCHHCRPNLHHDVSGDSWDEWHWHWQVGRGLVRALGKILSTARPVLPPRCQPPDPIAFYFLGGEENGLCYKMALYTGSIFWLDNTKFNFTSSGSFQPRFLNHKVYFCKNRDLLPHRSYQELRILNFIQRL